MAERNVPGDVYAEKPSCHYWLWPLAVVYRDDVGWLVVPALLPWTVRLLVGRKR